MISRFFKYGLFILWTVMLLIQVRKIPINGNFVYIFLGINLFFSFFILYKNPKILINKSFIPLLLISIINIIYFLFIDRTYNSFLYVLAKLSTFLLIIISIYYYFDYIAKNISKIIILIGLMVVFYGVIVNPNFFGMRYSGPFGNPNSLGFLSALLFGLTYLKSTKNYKTIFILIFLLFLVMLSGSRAAFGGVILAILLQGTFSFKKILYIIAGIIALIGAQNIASKVGVHTGLERIIKSEKSNELLSGREKEYALGILTIKESPILGNGLDKYAWISPKIIRESGLRRIDPNFVGNPHNSYIAMFIMYGIPTGLIILVVLIYYILKIIFTGVKQQDLLFLLLYTFIGSFFESRLFGVSGFEGLLFWIVLPLILTVIYQRQQS